MSAPDPPDPFGERDEVAILGSQVVEDLRSLLGRLDAQIDRLHRHHLDTAPLERVRASLVSGAVEIEGITLEALYGEAEDER